MQSTDDKERQSYFAANQMVSRSSSFGRTHGIFRSIWELRFSHYLDDFNIDWEFEPRSFEIKDSSGVRVNYIPDFYLPKYNIYIEVAATMFKRLRYKNLWFTEQHTKERLIIITKTDIKRLIRGDYFLYPILKGNRK